MVRHTRESGPKSRSGQAEKKPQRTERIAKRLARAGVASRREVERLIGLGLVAVNGRILATPAVLVTRDDIVTVEGQVVGAAEATRLWRYHKPQGLLTTNKDPKDRATVFEHLPQDLPRVMTVGRLDLNSEGLLLLTNDGALARALELPANAWRRVYRARALGRVTQAKLDTLKDGIVVEGVSYGSIEATLDKAKEKDDGRANVWITLALNEGKNREVRRVLEALGLKVNRLLRLAYGPFQLGTLAPGEVEEVGPRVIREQLADFITPENLPAGARTATPTPAAGRRAGSALADPRRKPSRVRADDDKKAAEAIEREDRAPRERPARGDKPGKPFGAKPRREGGFGDRKGPGAGEKRPRADRASGEARASTFGDKTPRSSGGFGARKSSDAERPRSDRATSARKTSGFGEKPARGEGGFGARKASAGGEEWRPRTDRATGPRKASGFGEKPARGEGGFGARKASNSEERRPRSDRPAGARKASGFGDKRPRDEGGRAERKPSAFGDKKPRSGPGFGRGKPAARTGEERPYKRRDDSRSDPRSNDRAGAGAKRPSKAFGEKRERPTGKPFAKPGAKPGDKLGGYRKTEAKPGGFKTSGGKPAGFKTTGDKGRSFTKSGPPRGDRAGPARGPKPAGAKPRGPTPRSRPGSGPRGPKRG